MSTQPKQTCAGITRKGREYESGSGQEKRGIVLPFETHSITFDNIRYEVDMPLVFSKTYHAQEESSNCYTNHYLLIPAGDEELWYQPRPARTT